MRVVAHDPFISAEVAADLGVELLSLDEVCAAADYLTLHLPATADTRHLFDDDRFAQVQAGHPHHQHGARRARSTRRARPRDRRRASSPAPALDVFETEPPTDWTLATLPQVVATPHIAASTEEAQELVGVETAATVRDFLRDGVVRNAVNFPSVPPDELQRLQPWIRLAERLGSLVVADGRGADRRRSASATTASSPRPRRRACSPARAAAGVLRPILSGGVSIVNARAVARASAASRSSSRAARGRATSRACCR